MPTASSSRRKARARKYPQGLRYYKREFLNLPGWHEGAYIIAEVSEYRNGASVQITDCSRVIRLDLEASSHASKRNTMRKLRILIETLTEVQDELAAGPPQGRAEHTAARATSEAGRG
jgi:hypothetical protein